MPHQTQEIRIDFTSTNARNYINSRVVIDVGCVGDAVISIPIYAQCVVPQVFIARCFDD